MSDIGTAAVQMLMAQAKRRSSKPHPETVNFVIGIAQDRPRPISTGWCGNDSCDHYEHKTRRAAQAAADTRRKNREGIRND